ncbi:MAG: hypothetical protein HQM10_02105 [Candidatus Riflebacteria bacterium]|nr:hypothetical protein [Candidatus Riflebacteria bacterium]
MSTKEIGSEKPDSDLKSSQKLDEKKQQEVNELKSTDAKVRAHEAAHLSAGSGLVSGGVSYGYKTGPDGKQYAVSGEVGIDTSPVANDPDATIRKMERVKRAALAPSDPSSQDRSVASQAESIKMSAQKEASEKKQVNAQPNTQASAYQKFSNASKPDSAAPKIDLFA